MADVRARENEAKLGGLEAEYLAAAKKQAAQHAHTLATAEVWMRPFRSVCLLFLI